MGISKDLATGIETRIPVGQAEIRAAARAAAAAAASEFFFKGGQMDYARISEVREAERAVVFAISALNGQQLIQVPRLRHADRARSQQSKGRDRRSPSSPGARCVRYTCRP